MASTNNLESNEGEDQPGPSVNRYRYPPTHVRNTGFKYEKDEKTRPKRKFREMSDPDVLHRAVYTYDKIFVEALVISDFDVNTLNDQCEAPTHIATVKGHMDLLRYLVENGASVNLRDNEGRIPLHVAAENGNPDPEGRYLQIAQYLVDKCKTNVNELDARDNTPLHKAARSGSLSIAKLLLQNEAEVDILNLRGETALHNAIFQKNLSIVNLLLAFKADPKLRCSKGFTYLYYAVRSGSADIVDTLLEHGADINESICVESLTVSRVCRPILHLAIERGNVEIVKLLLEENPDINAENSSGDGALHIAARAGCLPIVELLLDYGADVKQINEEGVTALYVAFENNHENVAKLLLARGAKWSQKGYHGHSMLHIAIKNKKEKLFEFLLNKKKINPNIQDDLGKTPLHLAVENTNLSYTRMLLNHGARLNIKCERGMTPLHVAIDNRRSKVYKMLLKHGADVDACDNENRTPLHYSVLRNCYIAAETLLRKKANMNAVTKLGDTPLHYTIKLKQMDIFQLLLWYEADLTIPDNLGYTPLHLCIVHQRSYQLKNPPNHTFFTKLMHENADIEIKTANSNGYTPLHLAVKNNCLHFVKQLLEYGANVNSVDKKGKTPLQLAVKDGNRSCIEQLLIYGANTDAPYSEETIPLYDNHSDQIDSIFENFLLKKAMAGFKVQEFKIRRLRTEEEELEAQREKVDFIIRCGDEIEKMKETKLSRQMTYYQFLSLPIKKLVECASMPEVAKVFKQNDHQQIFPIYGGMLEKSFSTGVRFGEHMSTVMMVIFIQTNFLFNQDIIDKIVSFLDLKDMRKLVYHAKINNLTNEEVELVENSSAES